MLLLRVILTMPRISPSKKSPSSGFFLTGFDFTTYRIEFSIKKEGIRIREKFILFKNNVISYFFT